jgi:D-arabinose 1-dehydrogenase-like Zn-dependent alcohol dehydrogenase
VPGHELAGEVAEVVQVGLMLEDDRSAPIPIDRVIARELELRGVHGMAVGRSDALLRLVTQCPPGPAVDPPADRPHDRSPRRGRRASRGPLRPREARSSSSD